MRLAALLRAGLLACAAIAAAPSPAAEAPPPPIDAFFDNPEFSDAELSPSGKYLAVRVSGKGSRDRLAVVDLASNKVNVVAFFTDADIGDYAWVNDERLIFGTADRQRGQGDLRYAPGLYAVNRDGAQFRQLASRSNDPVSTNPSRPVQPWNTYLLPQKSSQDSQFVYVTHPKIDGPGQIDYVDLQRLDTLTGHVKYIERPGTSMSWLLDSKGEPRITTTVVDDVETIHYRDPANDTWRKLVTVNAYTGGKGAFSPLAFGPDGTLYVVSRAGKDKSALHTFDFAANAISDQPVLKLDGYDFSGRLIMDRDKVLGVRYLSDTAGTYWFDPAMKALQQRIDAKLPGTVNLLTPPTRPDSPNILVQAFSDIEPLTTLVYNSVTQKFNLIGSGHARIDPEQMGRQTLVHYKARDGLDIPAWLTLPHGKDSAARLPMVVLVHGGPYVRGGAWGWSPDAQFLASRGYAVLEPEFRGSTGFGARHYRLGWKQWGLAMQDDIADGARWAIAQGTADAKRICIAGASYGGYATLMGLIKNPELFRCGIGWAGVTDINLMYNGSWFYASDLSDGWKQYGMPQLVGDPVKDAAQLKATSPLLQADKIRQPLLLAYGGADLRVPLNHGLKFRDAVRAGNASVEWIEYPEEGHGWALPKNRIDFWGRVEKFLARNIGSPE